MSNVIDLSPRLNEQALEVVDQKVRDTLQTAVLDAISDGLTPQDILRTVREAIKLQRQWERDSDMD